LAPPRVLTEHEVAAGLATLPGWAVRNGKLHKTFQFSDFAEAFGFMTRVALAAEAMGHHPEWLNVWNTVTVDLVTHDADGITVKDLDLARKMESLAT
jgi:4a-hydroxytetrahydrobiopterin dehydratase